jgi:hypothetical protein
MLICLAITLLPTREFTARDADQLNNLLGRQLRYGRPIKNKIDDLISYFSCYPLLS